MRRRSTVVLASVSLVLGTIAAMPAHAQDRGADRATDAGLSVWNAQVTQKQVPLLLKAGVDGHELTEQVPAKGKAPVELILTDRQAKALQAQGVTLKEHRVSASSARMAKAAGDGVFRPYSGPGGLKQEIVETGQAHPELTKVVSVGKSLKGQDILAVKVTKDARTTRDGKKPSVLYMSNQHAREWITPEMTRRLMHHVIDGYGKDEEITDLVNTTELWFLLSANPDGYDFTHADPANRQWRKNLHDNDGDGKITSADGVDLNRNFAYKWGYDDEGSSPDPTDETFRGSGPMSEPETKALDAFEKRVGFEYGINYHSAAELLLYGVGWQVATPTPDDILYEALAGTPENSAIPGYRPQVSSELYTTNGEADGHAENVNGTLMFTPEMSTCRTASNVDPDDQWKPEDCASVFTFPDDEGLIQREFTKNLPFALSVAKTAAHPDQPTSSLGLEAADFTPDAFTASYTRDEQTVAVTARKSVGSKRLQYRVNGGRTHTERVRAWGGGERYGGKDNLYFDEYRGTAHGLRTGDKVEVWFTGRTAAGKRTTSEPFTFTVEDRTKGADTLVVAEEGGTTAAKHAQTYVTALAGTGRKAAVWDVATQGAPHALGVLDHFRSVVWYTGAGRPGGATLLAVRAYVNEGGKLVQAGEFAGGPSVVGRAATDDFSQYYLGADSRISLKSPPRFDATGSLGGADATLGDAEGNPLDAAGAYTVTSDRLKPADFPQFRSASGGMYEGVKSPFEPYEGEWFAAALHKDDAWMRLARTVDLTGVAAGDTPELRFWLSHDTEPGYDNLVLEAHTSGQDDWTTLPEAGGATDNGVPEECDAGFYVGEHPFLSHYLTVSETGCEAKGSTGSWNRFTGSSDGWQEVTFDLSAYAGKKVDLSLAYITDPGSGGRGVFADDTRLVVGGQDRDAEGFETSLGSWTVAGPPEDSPGNTGDWARSQKLFSSAAAVTTRDSVVLGFGLEHVPDRAERVRLIRSALSHVFQRR